jgi:hypothetical protein
MGKNGRHLWHLPVVFSNAGMSLNGEFEAGSADGFFSG